MNQTKLLVMTYNIHSGKDNKGRGTFDKILKFLQCISPDIVALQEINENRVRGFQISQAKKELNYDIHFGPNVKLHGGQYGIVTLSKLPMIKKQHFFLPSITEQRGILHSTISIEDQILNIYNTHLGLNKLERLSQFKIMNKIIKNNSKNTHSLLLGDFNTTQPIYDPSLLYDSDIHGLPTLIGSDKKVDYILASHQIKFLKMEPLDIFYSDHFPIFAEIIIK